MSAPPTQPAPTPGLMTATAPPPAKGDPKPGNFLRAIVERDLDADAHAGRRFAGTPGDAAHHGSGPVDAARIRTRFPPEPNGYLHIGHAKSICLNFGLARDYGGVCHLRFDDTNPEKEEQEYVDAIIDAVHWLGFDWTSHDADGRIVEHLYFASSYFETMYRAAEHLVLGGHAYVDEQSADEMRAARGDFVTPGTPSPWRDRSPADNLARLREMRAGAHADGAMVLRAKIDMASPNINLRDPTLYRIKRATHHATGDAWCIYPMYTFAHPIEDALERITHSICTLEFEDQRPFYDWLLERLAEPVTGADGSVASAALLAPPLPRQYEFARLNVTHVITSKRKLRALVDDRIVSGWDDPRMPTIAGLRRRGYTPASLQLFAERTGVSKAGGWVDYASLDGALRDDLDPKAPRAMAVLDPLKLVITDWDELMGAGTIDACTAPALPGAAGAGLAPRRFGIGREVWIERDDFAEVPPKGYHRLLSRQPGAAEVRPCRRMHRLHEGRRRPHRRGAGDAGARHQERHARRRRGEGQGRRHLGRRAGRGGGRGASLRAAVPRRASRHRRPGLHGRPEPGEPAGGRRRWSSRRSPTPPPRTASSSSATATSSPTASTMRRDGRCSTASPG